MIATTESYSEGRPTRRRKTRSVSEIGTTARVKVLAKARAWNRWLGRPCLLETKGLPSLTHVPKVPLKNRIIVLVSTSISHRIFIFDRPMDLLLSYWPCSSVVRSVNGVPEDGSRFRCIFNV
ncbi:hypothetical protein Droror1_Dr00023301 [Drosera rotundifolia]